MISLSREKPDPLAHQATRRFNTHSPEPTFYVYNYSHKVVYIWNFHVGKIHHTSPRGVCMHFNVREWVTNWLRHAVHFPLDKFPIARRYLPYHFASFSAAPEKYERSHPSLWARRQWVFLPITLCANMCQVWRHRRSELDSHLNDSICGACSFFLIHWLCVDRRGKNLRVKDAGQQSGKVCAAPPLLGEKCTFTLPKVKSIVTESVVSANRA